MSAIQSGLRDAIQAAVPPLYAVRAMSTGVWCWATSFLSKHIDDSMFRQHHRDMESSTANQITTPGNQNFFLSPQSPMQRQYEALRAYLLEEEPSADVARRFGYSAGAFRVLCYQFRHDPQKRASFFRQPQRGPQSSPARDRVRDLAVAMRKRNLSVYDMQRELAAAGHTISINSLTACSVRRASRVFPAAPTTNAGYGEAGGRRRRRCAPLGSVPLFLPYPIGRSVPVSAFAGSH